MDKQTAVNFVTRIEAHRSREDAIWQEMRDCPDYEMHEDKNIASILSARKRARDLLEEARSDLAAFDWVDDGNGNLVPREEVEADDPAWTTISAELRKAAGSNKKLLKIVGQVDRLHELAIERGLPVISRADLEREVRERQSA